MEAKWIFVSVYNNLREPWLLVLRLYFMRASSALSALVR
jgi:hypothetical protein